MNAEHFEERLLQELKSYVDERSAEAVGRRAPRRTMPRLSPSSPRPRPGHRTYLRLALGGIGVAVAVAVGIAATLSVRPNTEQTPYMPTAGPLPHAQNAAFAVEAQPSGAVVIVILDGSGKPDTNALRSDLARAGVHARVMADVPTCAQLAKIPGAPTPVGSAQAQVVADPLDFPFTDHGDLAYSVDASARADGTTLTIMFSSTLATIFLERTASSGPLPNCLPDGAGS